MNAKDIFISYASQDKEIAIRLREILYAWFGERVWMRFFDLNGGDLVASILDTAMTEAKWFVILLSDAALQSEWIRKDAHFGTLRSLESDDFRIIIVRLDACEYPQHLRIALQASEHAVFDLTQKADLEDGFMEIASFIEEAATTYSPEFEVYEGRGSDRDYFRMIARRNKILFVIGWHGIGKTAFVVNSVESAIQNRRLRRIDLTHGHSRDLLAREIIGAMHVTPQPISESLSDDILEASAIDALRKRGHRFALFLDSAQNGLDESNRLLPYLNDFLLDFQQAEIDTWLILATTRNPDYPTELTKTTDIYPLGPLEGEFIREIIYQWLEGYERQGLFSHWSSEAEQLVRLVGGHPLAAKRLAQYLKVQSPKQLLDRSESFRIGFAEYILREMQSALTPEHCSVLQILAVIREPASLSDMLSVKALTNRLSLEAIQQALFELSNLLLLEQKGELIYLHGFLATYYARQIRSDQQLWQDVASDFGLYAFDKAAELHGRLNTAQEMANEEGVVQLSNEVFRYSLSADRLLRLVGKDELADQLPIRTKGVLRGLVYHFYQEVRDYRRALDYVERWLQFNPDDSDIRLYQIRCLRRLGGKDHFERARELITRMESEEPKLQVQVRLMREKALIAQYEGDIELAKAHFRQAINFDRRQRPYSELHAGLARLLLRETDNLDEWDPKRQALASEAVELLEIAKKEPENFYRFHLDAYVEALSQIGKDEIAAPLLDEALMYRPDDGKLHFRKAEILRKRREYEAATEHAECAVKNGYIPSLITHANILFDQAVELIASGRRDAANEAFDQALEKIRIYKEQYGYTRSASDIEVADSVRSKIYRAKGNLDEAQAIMWEYRGSNNPYSVYEQSVLLVMKSDEAISDERPADAWAHIRDAISCIEDYRFELSPQLQNLYDSATTKEEKIRELLGV